MKRHTLLLSFLAVVLLTAEQCDFSDNVNPESDAHNSTICGKSDPINELTWLKHMIDKKTEKTHHSVLTPFKLVAFNYKGKTFVEDQSFVHSSPYIHVFNCDGSHALQADGEYADFISNRKEIKVLYEFK